jgi:DNA-directed RNA polymerase sigma subunit (sigma70/sigma32)
MVVKENDLLSDYLQSLYGIELLPVEEEHRLAGLIAKGDTQALEKLVTHNLRFVVHIVRQMTAWQYGKVPIEDMIGMGNESLFRAARQWTPTNNARFATFANSFIRMDVRRDLDNTANLIRLPINVMEEIKRLNYHTKSLTQLLCRTPTVAELAEKMGVEDAKIYEIQNNINKEPISINNLKQENNIEEGADD